MGQVLVVGASRGLGLEFVRQYRAEAWHCVATARDAAALVTIGHLGARGLRLDVNDADAADRLGAAIADSSLDVAIVCAGIFGPRSTGLDAPSAEAFDAVMRTNVLGPMRILPVIVPRLAQGTGKLAVLSSRMGSIGERSSNAGWLYRASKAAVNSVLQDAALAAAARGVTCVALHPGWVRTDMGGPNADIDAGPSVAGMRHVLATLPAEPRGRFLNYDGTPICW